LKTLRNNNTALIAKRIVRGLLPPFLVDILRRIQPTARSRFVWDGIYQHRRDVPTLNAGADYDVDQRIDEMVKDARRSLRLVHAGTNNVDWHEALGVLAGLVHSEKGRVRVLDFGGGIGHSFIQLLGTIGATAAVEYQIVELEKMSAAGREFFAHEPRVHFHTEVPVLADGVDIVYLSSVLPYIEDYADLLRSLARVRAPYLLLARFAAGRFPTYAAKQLNLPGQVLAYWFLNTDEIIKILDEVRYSLAYDGLVGPTYDQSNFPESHRMGRMRTMLFVRR
jgi:putative methyltransferase (TIGR04325 family)